jgi:hypothetical protein
MTRGVEEVNKRRKKRANLTAYPGTNPPGLKHPPVPTKKKRDRKEQDVVGTSSGKDIPYVKTAVGVTTLSNQYKGHVTSYNKCGIDAEKATTDTEREKQGVQRAERLRQIRLIEDTFASGQFLRFGRRRAASGGLLQEGCFRRAASGGLLQRPSFWHYILTES